MATLQGIVGGHAKSIAFENLDPFLGVTPLLDVASLQEKLVHGGRGGYCFEHNLLLSNALSALGFRASGLAARVLWGRPEGGPLPMLSHMLVRVELPEGTHVVDVGFGGLTPTGVLALQPDVAQATPHEPFRLRPIGDEFLMEVKLGEAWTTLYRFGLGEAALADYEVFNWYLSNHPQSHFVNALVAARPDEERRYALRGREFTVHHLDGRKDERILDAPGELLEVLEDAFGVDTSSVAGLESGLARLF